jgi:hypothetical protein
MSGLGFALLQQGLTAKTAREKTLTDPRPSNHTMSILGAPSFPSPKRQTIVVNKVGGLYLPFSPVKTNSTPFETTQSLPATV